MSTKTFTPPKVRSYRSNTNGFFFGTVINNKDLENKGRVQVNFQNVEQHGNAWYEVIAFNAGGGAGVHFTPAKGDTAVGGFINNKIYIFGFIHQGKDVKDHAYSDPKVFAITSRTKSALEFNDNENEGSVKLHDHKSSIHMDGKDTLTIQAPKIINILCGEKGKETGIQINGETGTISLIGKHIYIGDSKGNRSENMTFKAESLFMEGKDITINADQKLTKSGKLVQIQGQQVIIA